MKVGWLIVGGGIHGTHIAARLIADAQVSPDDLLILDPCPRLLERWRESSRRVGMTYLRSPAVHHLGVEPFDLHSFSEHRFRGGGAHFAPPYDRPLLRMFDAHCDEVIEQFQLHALHLRGLASGITVEPDCIAVSCADGSSIFADRVVLALGVDAHSELPSWVPESCELVRHIFQPMLGDLPTERSSVAVVGGGISAAQAAISLGRRGRSTHLISRHPLREHQFDSDPGWLGPKFMDAFRAERDLEARSAMIKAARHRGSVPPDVKGELEEAVLSGRIDWRVAEVSGLRVSSERVELRFANGAPLVVDRVLLGTGFGSKRPGGTLVDELIESAGLPCSASGYPVVDIGLRWHPRIFVSGALAELELGPTARNIAGARRSADRIVWAARSTKNRTHSRQGSGAIA